MLKKTIVMILLALGVLGTTAVFAYGMFGMGHMQGGPVRGDLNFGNWTGEFGHEGNRAEWNAGFGARVNAGLHGGFGNAHNMSGGFGNGWNGTARNETGYFGGRGPFFAAGNGIFNSTEWQARMNETAQERFDSMSAMMNGNYDAAKQIFSQYGIGPAWLADEQAVALQQQMHQAIMSGDYASYSSLRGQMRTSMQESSQGMGNRGRGMMGGFFGRGPA
ncbi:MAG: hypothetical protein V1822_01625 [Candidatus Micrarchaeota archaeon]